MDIVFVQHDGSHGHFSLRNWFKAGQWMTENCPCPAGVELLKEMEQVKEELRQIQENHRQLSERIVKAIGPNQSACVWRPGTPNEKVYPLQTVVKVAAVALVGMAAATWGLLKI
jgi:hypothetical protein